MSVCPIANIGVVVTYGKTHPNVHFKRVNFILCQLYFKKVDFVKSKCYGGGKGNRERRSSGDPPLIL